MTKLQLTMRMFLQNQGDWFSNRDLNFGVTIDGTTLILNYLTDEVKYLERIVLPSGNRLKLDRNRVKKDGKLITYYRLPVDMISEDYIFISDKNNIKTVKMAKSKSLFDRIKTKWFK